MLYREIIAVCSQIHTKHINTLCGQNVDSVNVKPGGTYSDHWSLNGQYKEISIRRTKALKAISQRCLTRSVHVSHFGAGFVAQHIYACQCATCGAVCTMAVSSSPFLCHIIFNTGEATLDELGVHTSGNNLEHSAYTCALQHSGNYTHHLHFIRTAYLRVSELHQPLSLCNADSSVFGVRQKWVFVHYLYEFWGFGGSKPLSTFPWYSQPNRWTLLYNL